MRMLVAAALVTALPPHPATTVIGNGFETRTGVWTTGTANCQGTGTAPPRDSG